MSATYRRLDESNVVHNAGGVASWITTQTRDYYKDAACLDWLDKITYTLGCCPNEPADCVEVVAYSKVRLACVQAWSGVMAKDVSLVKPYARLLLTRLLQLQAKAALHSDGRHPPWENLDAMCRTNRAVCSLALSVCREFGVLDRDVVDAIVNETATVVCRLGDVASLVDISDLAYGVVELPVDLRRAYVDVKKTMDKLGAGVPDAVRESVAAIRARCVRECKTVRRDAFEDLSLWFEGTDDDVFCREVCAYCSGPFFPIILDEDGAGRALVVRHAAWVLHVLRSVNKLPGETMELSRLVEEFEEERSAFRVQLENARKKQVDECDRCRALEEALEKEREEHEKIRKRGCELIAEQRRRADGLQAELDEAKAKNVALQAELDRAGEDSKTVHKEGGVSPRPADAATLTPAVGELAKVRRELADAKKEAEKWQEVCDRERATKQCGYEALLSEKKRAEDDLNNLRCDMQRLQGELAAVHHDMQAARSEKDAAQKSASALRAEVDKLSKSMSRVNTAPASFHKGDSFEAALFAKLRAALGDRKHLSVTRGGGANNLDIYVRSGDLVVGVECKHKTVASGADVARWRSDIMHPSFCGGVLAVLGERVTGIPGNVSMDGKSLVVCSGSVDELVTAIVPYLLFTFGSVVNDGSALVVEQHRTALKTLYGVWEKTKLELRKMDRALLDCVTTLVSPGGPSASHKFIGTRTEIGRSDPYDMKHKRAKQDGDQK
jgi:hypothetical protein